MHDPARRLLQAVLSLAALSTSACSEPMASPGCLGQERIPLQIVLANPEANAQNVPIDFGTLIYASPQARKIRLVHATQFVATTPVPLPANLPYPLAPLPATGGYRYFAVHVPAVLDHQTPYVVQDLETTTNSCGMTGAAYIDGGSHFITQ